MCLSDITAYKLWRHLGHTIFRHWCNVHDLSWCKVFFSSLAQYLLWETCCKKYAYNDETFLRKEVKLLSVRHNLWFSYIKMPVLETHLKIFNSYFLYIQQVVTRNKFIYLDFSYSHNLYMNLLWTIISSLVNKNCYYIVILFLLCLPFYL